MRSIRLALAWPLYLLRRLRRESVKSPPRLPFLVTAKSSLLYVDVIPEGSFPHLLLAALPLHLRTTYSFSQQTMKSRKSSPQKA